MTRILVADDERDLVEVLAEILRDEGHEVRTAVDGLEALRVLEAWHPDVAVLDIDMPGMTGPSIAAELSKKGGLERTAVVLLSGNADVKGAAAEVGVPHCMTKPVSPDELMSVVDSAIAHQRQC